ncbi:hypothetical protein [Mesorhizobium amorphae]|uniref:Transmembrane protein n=1 Tax=Mesorhizobium amorphae CCNWGS0123 TaxID=1082933 RepID=G6YBP6_9HYPH|nr:hypothetical protein [Mesorhizobium amorphae]ANT49753.1 hypothetical protein A6B35_07275 [Mesorhizobium amorphae CCNWGS0123]EHH10887.1 hypothetical protein MEA186_16862 [Mesorhizobium amorphae CCNWGS0123]GLR40120.1 hypothetical protein GCM10007880_06360 [Mesorhizobium amorphae]
MSNVDAAGVRPTIKHWPVFWLLYAIGVVIIGLLTTNFWYGAGYMGIPALVGYFATRKASTFKGLLPGYVLFVGFMAILVYQQFQSGIRDGEAGIYKGCIGNKQAASSLSDDQLKGYCACMSKNLAPAGEWKAIETFAKFNAEPMRVQDYPDMMELISRTAQECAAALSK